MAPSPTGVLHVGTCRTALFNYVLAKKEKGKFVLRIEDTDKERSKPEFEKDIISDLKWLGIKWDEFHKQSQRMKIYAEYLEKLLKNGRAYRCFCSQEELARKRQEQIARGEAPKYNGKCRRLAQEQIEKNLKDKKPFVIRFKTPIQKVEFQDLIRGELEFDSSLIGDFTLAKGTKEPLYNFAVVVDDFKMGISHVIRGEDHISNTPKQILIQKALGFPEPKYAHLPLILGSDKSKLSKRHGAVSVSQYRQKGYLPEAMVNFLALLGWHPETEKEIFSMKELIEKFSLERVQKSGAVFNMEKLDYLNGYHIRQKSLDELADLCKPYLPEKAKKSEIKKIVSLYKDRLKTLSEIGELADFYFKDELDYEKNLLRWKNMEDREISASLDKLINILDKIKKNEWKEKKLKDILMKEAEEMGDRGKLLWPLRAALTGKKASAGPFEIAELLGKEKTLRRIKQAKEK